MSKHTKRQLDIRDLLVSRVKDLYARARLFCWTSDELMARRQSDIFGYSVWEKATGYTREFVRGYERACYDALCRFELVFAYDVDGRRLLIDSEEYKAISAKHVYDNATWEGHVWRHSPSCAYSGGRTFSEKIRQDVAKANGQN